MYFQLFLNFLWCQAGEVFHDHRLSCDIFVGKGSLHTKVRQNIRHHRSHCGRCYHIAGYIDAGAAGRGIQRNQYNILRIFHGRNPHKGNNFIQDPLSVFIENIDFFAGAGLSADGKTCNLCIFRCSFFHDGPDERAHRVRGFLADCLPHHSRFLLQDRIAVGIDHFGYQIGLYQIAAVYHRRNGAHQLQRGDFKGLAERAGGQGGRSPFFRVGNQGFIKEYTLALPRQINACLFQYTKLFDIFIELFAAQLQCDMGKGNIAGILQCLRCFLCPVTLTAPAVQQLRSAGYLLTAPAVVVRLQIDGPAVQRRRHSQHFKR